MKEIPLDITSFCKVCGKQLGYYEDKKSKRTFKRQYFSLTPFKINGINYKRIKCVDCFIEKNGRSPKSPNIVTHDYVELLDVPVSIIDELLKNKSVTLDNMIKRHGKEEGTKKFNDYREKQAISNTYEYKKMMYGWSIEDFNNYNNTRSVTLDNMIKRHGKEEGTKKFNDYREKQRRNGCSLDYFIEKYGKNEGTEFYNNLNKMKAITPENMKRKHGDGWKEKYENWYNSVNNNVHYYSKQSQTLFWSIYNKVDDEIKNNCYFATLNKEFNKYITNKYYLYDFVITGNVNCCIEFNGEHVHPNSNSSETWKQTFTSKSKNDIMKYDKEKIDVMKNEGFDVMIVWSNDYRLNPEKVINQCIDFINKCKNRGMI